MCGQPHTFDRTATHRKPLRTFCVFGISASSVSGGTACMDSSDSRLNLTVRAEASPLIALVSFFFLALRVFERAEFSALRFLQALVHYENDNKMR